MPYTLTAVEKTGRSGTVDRGRAGIYTRVFTVESSSPLTGPRQAMQAVKDTFGLDVGTPYQLGEAPDTVLGTTGDDWYEADSQSVVNAMTAQQISSDGLQWDVTVEFGSPEGVLPENPLLEEPEEEWGANAYERPVDQDSSGNPICNTAGDPFDPPPMRDDSRLVLTITRNEATADPALSREYGDTVNNATFYGAAAGKVKLKSRTARKVPFEGLPAGHYFKVTYVFEFNEDGWQKRLLNVGFRQLVSGNLVPIYMGTQLATSPCLLNSSGALTATPYFRTFDVYRSKDFGTFAFPGA